MPLSTPLIGFDGATTPTLMTYVFSRTPRVYRCDVCSDLLPAGTMAWLSTFDRGVACACCMDMCDACGGSFPDVAYITDDHTRCLACQRGHRN
jgi:hypothetical protein